VSAVIAWLKAWNARRRARAAEFERVWQYWHAKHRTYEQREHDAAVSMALRLLGLKK
jgi:hypothetical protein